MRAMPADEVVNRSITTTLIALRLLLAAFPSAAQNPPFSVNSYITASQSFPAMCADANGNFVVVWESGSPTLSGQDGSYLGIVGRRFVRGGAARGEEFAVNSYTTDYQTFPAISCGDDGAFVTTWSSFGQDGSAAGVFAQRFDAAGARAGTEFQVNAYTTGTQDYPSIGRAADGDFVVVWTSESQDGLGYGIFGQRFSDSGNRTGIEFRVNSYTTDDQGYPAISVSDAGSFVVTWVSNGQDGSGNGVFAQRFSSAALETGSEFRVNSTTAGNQGYPTIAMDGSGRFAVAWSSDGQDGDDTGIFARRYASDGAPIGGEFQVNTHTAGAQMFPRISAADGGELVVVWTSYGQDGDDAGVFGQRYASDGQREGTEFQVNQSTAGAQYSAVPARIADDDFVVVWATNDGGETGTDIAGRWYSAPTPTFTRTATRPPTATRTPTSVVEPSATVVPPTATVPPTEPTPTPIDTPTDIPTVMPTDVPTATPTETPAPTATPTEPPPTATATPGVTGDCDHDGTVSVNELVTGVNVALDRLELVRCDALDNNDDGVVSINELVAAVREALAA